MPLFIRLSDTETGYLHDTIADFLDTTEPVPEGVVWNPECLEFLGELRKKLSNFAEVNGWGPFRTLDR